MRIASAQPRSLMHISLSYYVLLFPIWGCRSHVLRHAARPQTVTVLGVRYAARTVRTLCQLYLYSIRALKLSYAFLVFLYASLGVPITALRFLVAADAKHWRLCRHVSKQSLFLRNLLSMLQSAKQRIRVGARLSSDTPGTD